MQIVTALISTPNVKTVRGFTDFGISYVCVIFEDRTDMSWARTRVVEYLQGIRGSGVGADLMKPIAAPIVGGMVTSTVHVRIVTPVIFYIMKVRALRRGTLRISEMAAAERRESGSGGDFAGIPPVSGLA